MGFAYTLAFMVFPFTQFQSYEKNTLRNHAAQLPCQVGNGCYCRDDPSPPRSRSAARATL